MTIEVCIECKGRGTTLVQVPREGNHGRESWGYETTNCPTCLGSGLVTKTIVYEPWKPESRNEAADV